jgi:hypothetical protein
MPGDTGKAVTLSREELYEKVWSTPMRKLAPAYGLSDVGLAKVCDRHNVPRPPRGYWAKKEFGRAPPRPPLPPCDDPALQTVRLTPEEKRPPEPPPPAPEPEYDADVMAALRKARALPPVTVGEALRGPHPLVQSTRAALERATPDRNGLLSAPWNAEEGTLNVSVSKDSLRRALCFLDALLKAVEKVGGKVEAVRTQWERETVVSFCGEKVATLRLRERYRQQERERPLKDYGDWRRHESVPTGRLVLDGASCYKPHCQDTEKGRRVEGSVDGLVVHWAEEAGRVRAERRRREEEARRREEEERRRRECEAEALRLRQELQRKQQEEQARVDRLLTDAAAWRQSQVLREYIAAVERAAMSRDGRVEEGGETARWLAWAREQADRLDPFALSPPSVLDEKA